MASLIINYILGIHWRQEKDIEITPIACCGSLTKRGCKFIKVNGKLSQFGPFHFIKYLLGHP